MDACVIFCAGGFDRLARPIAPGELVLAADAGVRHTRTLGVTPDVVLGDFDSLGSVPPGAVVYPAEKDDTDLMLAIRHGLAAGRREFLIYGALDGPRTDLTVASLQALHFLAAHGAHGFLWGLNSAATVIRNETLAFPAADGLISVFCSGADATGVTLRGLKYPLNNATLTAAMPLGVSNRFQLTPASVTVRDGYLLVLWDRDCGLPQIRKGIQI